MAAERSAPIAPRYGVAGWPVAHSRSPQIHRAAYATLGIDAIYQRLPLPPELFAETVLALAQSGFAGINVTVPHKQAALELADEVTDAARQIGAANTLTFVAGRIIGDNTDGPGLLDALGRELPGVDALVLGAGGTARAAVWVLRQAGAKVTVWNRTVARATQLAQAQEVEVAADLAGSAATAAIVVNCTTVGMDGDGDPLPSDIGLQPTQTIVDFVYADSATPLIRRAEAAGCPTVDGRELLARQGSLSFARWFDVDPPYEAMLAALD